ncbi:MAG TPA: MBL fold metallo-hydrolase [Methylophilaceae bacterium]|nr:MBL fold metallo-hydrolase [Methylophilaceae bacterium]
MNTKLSLIVVLPIILLFLGCATRPPPYVPAHPDRAKLTIIYDAFGKSSSLQKDWGYAALIEYGGKRILFDTGNNPAIFEHNIKAMHIDLTRLDFVVMSHRHGDHMGGLSYLLRVNPTVKIYAPQEGFGIYGASLPSSFYRQDTSLPPEQRYYDGRPPDVMQFGAAWPGANFQLVNQTTEIAPDIHLIALVSDKPGTLELRELSLAINTSDGMVVVVGCSHPGIHRILEAAARINSHIRLLAGGLHFVIAEDKDIEQTAAALHDEFKVDYIAPGHCTGEPMFNALRRVFGERYLYAGLGVNLGSGPHEARDAGQTGPAISAEEDLSHYRMLLAKEGPD